GGDGAGRQAALEEEGTRALDEADAAGRRDDVPRARASVQRVEGLVAGSATGDALQARLRQWRTDLEMVQWLEEILLQAASVKDESFDFAGAEAAYRTAFQWYGLDPEALASDAVAERIRSSAIRSRLVAG